jgi:hypothetical protein
MRTLFAPALAFAIASALVFVGLLLLGVPPLIATAVVFPLSVLAAERLGLRRHVDALALAIVAVVIFGASIALAQSSVVTAPDTTVHVAWGDLIGQIGVDLLPWAGLALLTVLTSLLPAPVRAIVEKFRTAQVDQLLERALGFAASQLQTRLQGQEINVDLHNALVAKAAQYAVDHGSKVVLDYAGTQALPEKIAARVLTSPAVQAAQGKLSPAFPSAAAK